MTLTEWAAVGQVAAAFFTFVGVIVSLSMALIALKEVRADRRANYAPFLAFEPGGSQYTVQLRALSDGEKRESDLPPDASRVSLEVRDNGTIPRMYGDLKNYGPGPAIQAEVTWIPTDIWLGKERFKLDDDKRTESKYSAEHNTIPAGHILPNQTADFFRLPAFIACDYAKQVTKVEGHLEITCIDLLHERHVTRQGFYIGTGYDSERPYIHFTFKDLEIEQVGDSLGA